MKVITHLVKWKDEPRIYFTVNVRGKKAGWRADSGSGLEVTCKVEVKRRPTQKRPNTAHELITINKRLDELQRTCDGQFQTVLEIIKKLMRSQARKHTKGAKISK